MAYSKTSEGLGGYYADANLPKTGTLSDFKPGAVGILIDSNKPVPFHKNYTGYKVYVFNQSEEKAAFEAQDSRLYMTLQARNKQGEWQDIMYLPSSWCGNSYHTLTLESGEYWEFTTPAFDGSFETEVRVALEKWNYSITDDSVIPTGKTCYSNSYSAKINPKQFTVKPDYQSGGLMDPYKN